MLIQLLHCMTQVEKNKRSMRDRMKEFDKYIKKRHGKSIRVETNPIVVLSEDNDIICDELY